jgi:hypothetical protein
MSWKVVVRPEAEEDLFETATWYEKQQDLAHNLSMRS